MRVLIAGCGYVGLELGRELSDAGHRVWALRRSAVDLPRPLTAVSADLDDRASLERLPRDIELAYYTAAPARPAGGSGESAAQAYRRTYVEGLQNLIDALVEQRQPVRRVVFTSSTGTYGQSDGSWVDERSPTEPARETGRALLRGEALLEAAPFATTVVRLSGIYGPGRARLLTMVERGEARVRGGAPRWTNRIHRDDCAGFLAHIATLAEPAPLYIGTDDEPVPYDDLLRWLADALGVAEPPPVEAADRAPGVGRAPGKNKRCRNRLLRASGYALRFPTFREGYGDLIQKGGWQR